MRILLFAALIGSAAPMLGCDADSPSSAEDFRIVATARNESASFAAVTTFTLPNTVQAIQDPDDPASNRTLSTQFNDQIIAQVRKNVTALGWQELTDPVGPKPNVFVQVSAMATTDTDVYYSSWYGYWGAYYAPWYGATYSAGWAPYAYPVVVTTNVGSLIIDMTDPNQPDPATQSFPSLWVGVVNGLLSPDIPQETVEALAISGIDQAFAQSPYLNE
jgi:hypothetical protein